MVNSFLWNPFVSGHIFLREIQVCIRSHCHRCQHISSESYLYLSWSGVENFIMTTVFGYPESETTCLVDDVYDLSQVDYLCLDHHHQYHHNYNHHHQDQNVQLDWLFGFNPSCRPGNASSPDCTQPSVIIIIIGDHVWW